MKLLIKHWRNKPIELDLEDDADLIFTATNESGSGEVCCINALHDCDGPRLHIQVLRKTTALLFLSSNTFEVML